MFCIFLFVKDGLDVISSQSCSVNEATAGLYVVTEQKAEFFFHTLLFCSKADFRTAFSKLNLRAHFFNEIVRVVSSTKA